MKTRYYSNWLKAFLEYASYGEAPLKMLWWTGVSTLAGALRRRVWLDMKYFEWTPCFYVILVAPPGIVSKSTTANIGINLLRKVSGINFGPDVVTWQSLVQSLGQSCEMVPDTQTGEYHAMSCLTIASDEFGTFLNPSDREMVDVLVSLWDGKRGVFTKTTKTSGNDSVENPWVNIIACTTPDWIAGNFPEYMIGGGFTSRCVFVFAEQKRQFVAYPDEAAAENFEDMQKKLIHDLEIISTMFGKYTISPTAREWGRQWYVEHWKSRPAHLDNDRFGGYLARKQTHIHKLSMVLAASESNNLVIEQPHLETASAMVSALELDMPKVFMRIGQNEVTRGSTELVRIAVQNPGITRTELYRRVFHSMAFKDFEAAMQGAINAGHLIQMQQGSELIVRALEGSAK